ncbi:MAG: Do family serine endopeptidase [candidate division WOR-3 bacterium]
MKKALGLVSIGIIGILVGLIVSARANITENLKAVESSEKGKQTVRTPNNAPTITIPSFADIAESVLPSVVNIEGTGKVRVEIPLDPFFEYFFGPQWREYRRNSLGSGFIFKKNGNTYYVMTNNHVVSGMDKITIKLYDGTVIEKVEIVGTDSATDIAVLKFESKDEFQVAKLGDSDELRVGDWVMAIGSPFGLSSTVTVGVISAKHREIGVMRDAPSIQDFLQTDAAINPGNSGGPLVNVKGEVVGVNTAIISRTGQYAGVGFAIPINIARNVAEQLIEKGRVERGYLGIYMQDVDMDIAKHFKLKKPYGVIITDVVKGSPAEKSGLKEGDIIVEIDGKEIKNSLQLRSYVQSKKPGESVKVKVLRNGKENVITVKLGSAEKFMTKAEKTEEKASSREIGITVKESGGKVIVDSVKPGSVAESVGIEPGDVILKVNDYEIKGIQDYEKAISEAKKKGSVLMLLQSGEIKKWVAFSL